MADNSTEVLLVDTSILHVPEPIANSQKVSTLFSLDSELSLSNKQLLNVFLA